jgi:putative Holliday junction resolvase
MGPLFAKVEGVLFFYKQCKKNPYIIKCGRLLSLWFMGRMMGIDFGLRRTGISVTDPLKIIVQGLESLKTEGLMAFIMEYSKKEVIDGFVVGYPFLEGAWGDKNFKVKLDEFIADLRKKFPTIPIELHDERFSSIDAREIIRQKGLKKNKREDKGLLDQTSAILILQEYLGHI